MDEVKTYKAFLSYSHSDQKIAHWLHNTLEAYKVPNRLAQDDNDLDPSSRRLGQIFIDRKELSAAGSLSKAVRDALSRSEFLIVVCSPAAAQSEWVNQEILEFKKLNGEDRIRCLIVEGEPFASRANRAPETECFPPALRYRVHAGGQLTAQFAEPIAADLRPHGDGRRMARLKLIAGLLGVGLDELVQRETHRRYRRMFAATAASVSGMVVMALLTLFAFQARSDAVDARGDAEERRAAAEDLIEFMLGDLTERLGPVGRLEVLDAVGTKALDYYGYAEPGELDTDSLARRARAMTLIGEIQGLRGNLQEASQAFQRSQETTGELMRRAPDDTQRIYDHAQSTFWMGYIHWQRGNQERAEPLFEAYLSLAERLTEIEPENTDWQVELGYGKVNMGALLMDRGEWAPAARAFRDGQRIFHTLVAHDPLRADWQIGLSDTHSWLASAFVELGNLAGARIERELELEIYRTVLAKDPNNSEAGAGLARSNRHLARLLLMTGETDASLKAYERATSLARQRMQNDPENSASAQLAGSAYISHAEALLTLGQTSKAERALVRADAVTEGLLGKDRSVLKWRVELYCQSEIARSHLYLLTGNLGRGLRHSTRVIKELSDLRGDHPDNQIIVFLLAQAHLIAGRLQDAAGRPDEARAAWQNTVTILISTGDRLKPQARADLAWAKLYLGQQDEARDLIRPLDDIGYAHPHFLALKSRLNEDETA